MSKATVSAWGHACIRFENDGRVLVIDPGTFSDLTVLDAAQSVLVTHEHPDHVAVSAVVSSMARADLEVWAPQVVVDQLVAAGAPAERVHVVAEAQSFEASGFEVLPVGNRHAQIHAEIPAPVNHAYLVDGVAFHPAIRRRPLPRAPDSRCCSSPSARRG